MKSQTEITENKSVGNLKHESLVEYIEFDGKILDKPRN
jgi:hypothetical protein